MESADTETPQAKPKPKAAADPGAFYAPIQAVRKIEELQPYVMPGAWAKHGRRWAPMRALTKGAFLRLEGVPAGVPRPEGWEA